jgi:hypothetical protein
MSLYDYEQAQGLRGESFATLIMAAALCADSINLVYLRNAFPRLVNEAEARFNAPGGRLPEDGPVFPGPVT